MKLSIEIDSEREVLTINGVNYSFALFGEIGFAPVGRVFRIAAREDGVVTLQTIGETEQVNSPNDWGFERCAK